MKSHPVESKETFGYLWVVMHVERDICSMFPFYIKYENERTSVQRYLKLYIRDINYSAVLIRV